MLAARVCQSGALTAPLISLLKTSVTSKPLIPRIQTARLFASDGRTTFRRFARTRRATISEQMTAGETAITIGKGALACGAVIGLGSLCYYGLGLSPSTGVIEYAQLWPQYVKDRVRATYFYLGGSILFTAAGTALCLRSPALTKMLMNHGWKSFFISFGALMGTGILVQSIPYREGFGAKQLAWILHTGTCGAVLAPLILLTGPLVLRAAWYTAGMVGALSAVAVCAPNEKFLRMGGPLAIGLGVVFASSVGSAFLSPATALGSGLYAMNLYGGLLLFSMLLLYDTQRIMKRAETYPIYGVSRPYDPINNAISVYMDVLNIFVRILTILANGGIRKQK